MITATDGNQCAVKALKYRGVPESIAVWSFREGLCSETSNRLGSQRTKKKMLIQPLPEAGALVLSELSQISNCAAVFARLLDYEYHFILGKKNKIQEFTISFSEEDFHHIAGLHKLRDNYMLRRNKADALQWILDGNLTDSDLQKSDFYSELEPRLFILQNLKTILDSNDTVYRFLSNKCKGSQIEAEWLLQNILQERPVYVFLIHRQQDNPEMLSCCSLFPKTERDFTLQKPRYTLLEKTKRQISTNDVTILYKSSG